MTIVSEKRNGIPSVSFSVYRDDVFLSMQQDLHQTNKLACADVIVRYNFILRNFAMVKDRYNLGGHWFSRRFLNGLQLTHDLRIRDEKDLMWFMLQYEHSAVNRIVDLPGIVIE